MDSRTIGIFVIFAAILIAILPDEDKPDNKTSKATTSVVYMDIDDIHAVFLQSDCTYNVQKLEKKAQGRTSFVAAYSSCPKVTVKTTTKGLAHGFQVGNSNPDGHSVSYVGNGDTFDCGGKCIVKIYHMKDVHAGHDDFDMPDAK